jgi:hypothetical protein
VVINLSGYEIYRFKDIILPMKLMLLKKEAFGLVTVIDNFIHLLRNWAQWVKVFSPQVVSEVEALYLRAGQPIAESRHNFR